ncbi:MAG TPA: flagellar basal body P-ring protein FlgI, partial [Caulobacteraceae bacterium]
TAQRIEQAINRFSPGTAQAENGTVIAIRAPAGQAMPAFLAQIEMLSVDVDSPARVVIDEVNGVIVMGESVRVSTIAIAQGNLTIAVQETPQVSQPAPFSQGRTVVTPQSEVNVEEERGRQMQIIGSGGQGASLRTLVNGLNALGVTPRDMISILQAIKAQGALQADIEVI